MLKVDSMGRTAVHYAAFFGKAKALRFLIESAAHWMPRLVNEIRHETFCFTFLLFFQRCIWKDTLTLVYYEQGSKMSASSHQALHVSIANIVGHSIIMIMGTRFSFFRVVMGSIDVRDYEGMSPLHCAAQYCKPKHVQVLYEGN